MVYRLSILVGLVLICFRLEAQYKTELTVAKDGSGEYQTIQDAVDASKAFPDKVVTIFIKNGIYKEKVLVPSCNSNLRFIGESIEKTILTWDDYFDKIDRGRNSTFYTATLTVEGAGFIAENMTIENTAGPVGQAVALHVTGDQSKFKNIKLKGHQDTLYVAGTNSRQYFKECYIEGTTDFIFGEATVFFEKCQIHSLSNSFITAASTPEGRAYGFVFWDCKLTAEENVDQVYLGRPWRDFAKTVYINCEMGKHILPVGWENWSSPSREKTTFYGEYGSSGPGGVTTGRAKWSHLLTKKDLRNYKAEKVLNTLPIESMDCKF